MNRKMMANTSSKISDLLLRSLDELSQENFKRFKDKLSFVDFDGRDNIPHGPLENADKIDTKNLLMKFYGDDIVLDVAIAVFNQINLRDFAAKLTEGKRKDYRMTYREHIQEEYQFMEDRNARLGEWVSLNSRYTQLLIVKEYRHWEAKQHEIMATGRRHAEILAKTATSITIETLFDIDEQTNTTPLVSKQPVQTIVLQGAAGIGKTMTVRKIMLDWASGKMYPGRFDYVFYISCREMNLCTRQTSVADLIVNSCPDRNAPIKDILMDPEKLLFIIDGFDELKFSLDQQTSCGCTDPSEKQPVELILGNLLRKKVLSKSFLLITTRPTALEKLHHCLKFPRYAEILGFSEEDREEYFHKFFDDKKQAAQAFGFVMENEILFTMCFVPIVCWIICTVMKQQMERGESLTQISETTTAVYMYFLSSLLKDHSCMSKLSREISLRKLCSLARDGVWQKIILFEEDDIQKHGLDVSNIQSLFLNKSIFHKNIYCEHAYSFIHLSFQEFFAALFYVLEGREETVKELVVEDVSKLLQSYEEPGSGYLMLTVRFLFGLLNIDRMKEIEKRLGYTASLETKSKLLNWIEEVSVALAAQSNKDLAEMRFHLELFHCLFEIQEEEIVTRAMDCFTCVQVSRTGFSKMMVATLSFCLKNCRRMQSLVLSFCSSQITARERRSRNQTMAQLDKAEDDHHSNSIIKGLVGGLTHPNCKVQKLGFLWCGLSYEDYRNLSSILRANRVVTELDLRGNSFRSFSMKPSGEGLRLLCEGLKHSNCMVQKLVLTNCCISSADCKHLASVLHTNQYLKELDLRGNEQGDSGVQLLCEGLKHPDCKLQKLVLSYCSLTEACCKDISDVLSTNQALRELDLERNELGIIKLLLMKYSGVQQLSEGLKHSSCKLEILRLGYCHIMAYDCKYLASVLSTSQNLKELDLSGNELGDSGVQMLCKGLKHPDCKLQKLGLSCCTLTAACCGDLSAVLCTNQTLRELDITANKLGDSGIHQLCEGLKHATCKLGILRLGYCGVTASVCKYLASVLSTNQTLEELHLTGNQQINSGLQLLCEGLKHPDCKLKKLVLSCCKFTAVYCGDLSSVLSTNQTLRELNLKRCELGDSGVQQLCEGLKHKTCKLKILRLGYCGVTASDCKYLASVLSTNQTLEELDLAGNKQINSGLQLLCEELKHPNCKLQRLGLSSCYFSDASKKDLVPVFHTNHCLKELDLRYNHLQVPLLTHFYKELKCHRRNLKIRISESSFLQFQQE
ncbi:NACHT, LRR and PYD domains-containing protein 12-like [Carettochelys insculpta]|uniref:NACHT, LRR and PYD domains-containing protein 12-like n=1 Tax=Carettochelys insculpta TaxID=44489 RepID=UPI003EBAE877